MIPVTATWQLAASVMQFTQPQRGYRLASDTQTIPRMTTTSGIKYIAVMAIQVTIIKSTSSTYHSYLAGHKQQQASFTTS